MSKKMRLTLNENGKALTETIEGVTMPADYSFATVNDFVHSIETQYEDLECLCLGMASHMEKLSKKLAEFNNPKNWTRSYNCYGNLINEHALYKPKLPKVQQANK
jgi:hypothetical protein